MLKWLKDHAAARRWSKVLSLWSNRPPPALYVTARCGGRCGLLGNIEISDGAVVAASAVVNKPVAAGHTAVGIPAKHLPPRAKKVRKQEL